MDQEQHVFRQPQEGDAMPVTANYILRNLHDMVVLL